MNNIVTNTAISLVKLMLQSIGYCPKPRLYGVSNSRRAKAWGTTGLDYGASGDARLWSAIVHALYPVARLLISCVSVVL